MPSFSIITPTYNRSSFLKRTIESVLKQEYGDWELIIIDDGSTDDTAEVVKQYYDQRIRYFYVEHQGAARSRNFGIDKARSSYITFLDSDDEAMSNWLAKFYSVISKNDYAIISCGYQRINLKGEKKIIYPQSFGHMNFKVNFKSGTLMFSSQVLKIIEGFDTDLPSGLNTDIFLRSIELIKSRELSHYCIEECLLKVYEHSGKRIRNNTYAVYAGTKILLTKHDEFFKRNLGLYSDFLSVMGVSQARMKNYKKAQSYFLKAFLMKPRVKILARFIFSSIPWLNKKIWKK